MEENSQEDPMNKLMDFEYNTTSTPIIKVIGVGGGGGNAVSHMYKENVRSVSFAICNTDLQVLNSSPIPTKILLGDNGLGAGSKPMVARQAAEESEEEIKELLSDGTQMAFITAGMGGGTGTGAAPVVARISREMGILTIGIITIPFLFEGRRKINQAFEGVDAMGKEVDALLVINNEKLREVYPQLNVLNALGMADETLTKAARSIAEIITETGYINRDFADVKTTLKDGGVAVISFGIGEGENRLNKAIESALHSPLLNNNSVYDAQKILIVLYFSKESQLEMREMAALNEFIGNFKDDVHVIWGAYFDDSLGQAVKVTLLASGFGLPSSSGELGGKRTGTQVVTFNNSEKEKKENETPQVDPKIRLENYYGKGASGPKKVTLVKLSLEEMDDDKLIDLLWRMPTYNRDTQVIQSISREKTSSKNNGKEGTSAGGGEMIHFN